MSLVIGSEECPIPKVVTVLSRNSQFAIFARKWKRVAVDLYVTELKIKELQRDLILSKIYLDDVAEELVVLWVATNGDNARLQALVNVLEKNGLSGCAGSLKKEFLKEKGLEDLSKAFENKIELRPKPERNKIKDLNKKGVGGNAFLHLAVEGQDLERVEELIESGAEVNAFNKLRQTPLHLAGISVHNNGTETSIAILYCLIDNGANLTQTNFRSATFLHELVRFGTKLSPLDFHKIVKFLVAKGNAKLFDKMDGLFYATPLQWAVRHLEVEEKTLRLLHSNGANFNFIKNHKRLSVLVCAIDGMRSMELVNNLIKFGANHTVLDRDNNNLLHVAALVSNVDALKLLLRLGGLDINEKNNDGETPLEWAIMKSSGSENFEEFVRILIKEGGANTNIKDKKGKSLIEKAMEKNQHVDELTNLLLGNM